MDFEWEERSEDTTFREHMIAGCLAGVAEHISILPFDQIKTHMQVERTGKHHNFLDVTKSVYRTGGIKAFWRGGSTIIFGCAPAHAAYFSIYELSKTLLNIKDEKIYPILFGATGILASIVHDIIMNPFDVIKQRSQIIKELKPLQIAKKTFREEGFISFYRSLPVTILMNIPWSFALVSANENLKVVFDLNNNPNFFKFFFCAAFSAGIASVLTIPFDNIKTRLQTQNWKDTLYENDTQKSEKVKSAGLTQKPITQFSTISENIVKYKNIHQTVQLIFFEEGMKGFMRGLTPRIISQTPSAAISWSVYETLKGFLKPKTHKSF